MWRDWLQPCVQEIRCSQEALGEEARQSQSTVNPCVTDVERFPLQHAFGCHPTHGETLFQPWMELKNAGKATGRVSPRPSDVFDQRSIPGSSGSTEHSSMYPLKSFVAPDLLALKLRWLTRHQRWSLFSFSSLLPTRFLPSVSPSSIGCVQYQYRSRPSCVVFFMCWRSCTMFVAGVRRGWSARRHPFRHRRLQPVDAWHHRRTERSNQKFVFKDCSGIQWARMRFK